MVQKLQPLLVRMGPGVGVFGFAAYEFHSLFKKFQAMLRAEGAESFTLKVRAGNCFSRGWGPPWAAVGGK